MEDFNKKMNRKEQLDIDARARYQDAINNIAMDQVFCLLLTS